MKLLTYRYDGEETIGRMSPDLRYVWPISQFGFAQKDMNSFIESVSEADLARLAAVETAKVVIPYADVGKCAPIPIPRQDLLCLGMNFASHRDEAAVFKLDDPSRDKGYAVYFAKHVNEAVPDGGYIDWHADITRQLDYEAELGVVIGRNAYKVAKEDVFDYVLGYTVINDVSARDLQKRHVQVVFGKGLDGFTPMGPWIATKDEFAVPPALRIRCWVNGELRQDAYTDQMLFSIAEAISELSGGITLKAGSVISMGSPSGVGMGLDPPQFLKAGDVVKIEIGGIGTITNMVR